jgi:hypothetical protein
MATSDPFNAVGGISVGIPAIQVIDSNGNVITSNLSVANITGGNMTITGNIMVGGIKTDNYYYSMCTSCFWWWRRKWIHSSNN